MTTPEYEFYLRDARSLDFLGELRPGDVAAKWTRRDVAGGSFEIAVPRDLVALSALEPHTVVDVRRDGASEFVGILERRQIDRLGRMWTLSGPDALGWWLSQRRVGPVTADDRTGVAEDVAVDYVSDYLGVTAPAAQRGTSYLLGGRTFSVPASSGRGGAVRIASGRRTLAAVVEEICRAGDVVPSLSFSADAGYEFLVANPTDATSGSGAVPFSVDWDNVEALTYAEDYRNYWNYLWVMGAGSGDSRPYDVVEDADSVASHFRREGVIDVRYATSSADRVAVGTADLARRSQALVTVQAKPFRASGGAVYREHFDVGWDVTFGESELRSESVDIRVVSVSVELSVERGEEITFELGLHRANSQLRRLEDAIRLLQVANLE